MPEQLQVLIVEDEPTDAALVMRELKRSGLDFAWERVDNEADYVSRLKPSVDLILSDYQMPQFSGLRALELLNERPELEIPFIIISGTIGEETAVAAMRQGAADYLLKDRITRLGPAVRRALQEVKEHAHTKQLQAQFIEAQKMEVVGHLAGGVAHDFNNVLAVIMGYCDLILQDLGPGHALLKYAEEIQHASKRAAGLTQQLLIFSRKQTVQVVELDLNEIVKGMEKMLRQLINENIEMTIDCGPNIGLIRADSGYIWQVVMNLVVNARDAMPNGGKLVIATSAVTLDRKYAEAHPDTTPGDYALLSVSDTGIGMTNEVRKRLFEAFFTTKAAGKGTGLGLVTCQTIVRQCGGQIDVSSEIGKGTTFKVYFPRAPLLSQTSTQALPKAGPIKRGTELVLVVEDDPFLRNLAQSVLKTKGYGVLTATNGQDALRIAREHKGPPIALVVTDVIMPQMGGKVMAEWLKVTFPGIKILFTSGYTEDAIVQDGMIAKGVDFLPKPYTPSSLSRKVREILDAPAPSTSSTTKP